MSAHTAVQPHRTEPASTLDFSVEYRTGDLFDTPGGDSRGRGAVDAIGHGVNCRGFMGAGIAVLFRRRWPEMYEEYRLACVRRQLLLGDFMPYCAELDSVSRPLWVYNLATQEQPGPNASLDAIRCSVAAAMHHASTVGVRSIALPRLGAGIGGLQWERVKQTLDEVAKVEGPLTGVRLVVATPA